MGTIALVGGMVGDTLDGVTSHGLHALEQAERVVFPGDWIGDSLRERLGGRLRYGRVLTQDDVLEIFSDVETGAVLYAGSPRVFTGRPGHFPSAEELAARLEEAGHSVRWIPGCSFAELALHAADFSLDVERRDALVVPPALHGDTGNGSALAEYARTPATLVMLWAEDCGAEAWQVLCDARGESAEVAIVSKMGTNEEHVSHGTLGELEHSFARLDLPATIVVRPGEKRRQAKSPDRRRLAVAVLGSPRSSDVDLETAEALGRALVDHGCTVVCGGLGGIMEAACRGAHSSSKYQYGATVGIVPTYEPNDANEYCDIVIATGLNHARNVVVAASADVVAAVGGRAGTLTEIGFGWTLGRPVVAVTADGWASELAGRALDDRRDDVVHGPLSPEEAATLCVQLGANRSEKRGEF